MPIFLDQKYLWTLCEAFFFLKKGLYLNHYAKEERKWPIEERWVLGLSGCCCFFPALDKTKCYCSDIRIDCIMLCIKGYIIMWLACIEIQRNYHSTVGRNSLKFLIYEYQLCSHTFVNTNVY